MAVFHENFGGFSEHFSDFDLQSEHFILKISWFLPSAYWPKRLPSEVPKSDIGHSNIQQVWQEEWLSDSVEPPAQPPLERPIAKKMDKNPTSSQRHIWDNLPKEMANQRRHVK